MNYKIIKILALLTVLLTLGTALLTGCKKDVDPTEPVGTTSQAENQMPTEETQPREPGVYYVTVLPTANGTVTADRTEAKKGEKITLTVTPDQGYELITLIVNGKHGENTFEMPEEDVTVLARFGLPKGKEPEKEYPNGDFFGSVGSYHSSDVLDMQTDSGKNPYLLIDSKKGTPQYAYVKGVTAERFYLELKAKVTGIRTDEQYPKFGLMTHDGKEMVKFYLDMNTDKMVGAVGAVHQKNGKADDWAGQRVWNLAKRLDLASKSVKLGLLRNGNHYYFYVNGQLVATGNELSKNSAATGIFSFGTSLKVTDYKLVKEEEGLNDLLATAKKDAEQFSGVALTENFFKKTANGVYTLTTNSDAQHLVDDVIVAGKTMREAYYSLQGTLTLTKANDWGQARILISADPQNEYVIALEKTGDNKYQIFTMSKANEENWDHWTLIDDAEQNGNRNSLNFEIVVIGNKQYFLVDNEVYYTASDVPMTQSTVKFTGFNVGTTTVEDLILQVFDSAADAEAYANAKASRFGETFGVSQNSYWTTTGVDLSGDSGNAPVVQITGGAPQYAYLNDVFTDKFVFESQFNVQEVLNGDAYPKFGILVNGDSEMVKFFVDMTSAMTANKVGVVYQPANGGDDWANSVSCDVPGMAFTGEDTVKLKVVRNGRAYYFYVNDMLMLYDEAGFKAEKGAVGIFSFNGVLTASDYAVAVGADADASITQAKADTQALSKVGLSTNYFTQTAENVYTLTTDSDAQHKVDDVVIGRTPLRAANYRVSGKLSLTNANDWGQARILISADARNEYFIALEQISNNCYQIFAMSKADEENWNEWQLIESGTRNGSRNAIDFEIIAIGDQLYFLIEDEICYKSSRVGMTESSVKFTGYNVGTTTVENLSVQIFEDSASAAAYADGKNSRIGENFGTSKGSYVTTEGVSLRNDRGENPTVAITGGAPQYAYLNDVFTDKFVFESQFNVQEVLNGDAYPKFGILVNGDSEMVKFFVDMTSAMTANKVGVVYQPTNGGDDWANSVSCDVPGMTFTGNQTVKLKLIRNGRAYYFYVNDTLVLYNETGFKAEKGAVGIFSFNAKLTASGYGVALGSDANSAIENAQAEVAERNKLGLTCNWFADKGNGVYTLTTDSNAEHKVDDLTRGGSVLRAANYSVSGKLSLTNANDWGQARILISADAKNEYFIAVEKLPSGKYQVFTMSKGNENNWNVWQSILSEDQNGFRNSIDFELIVIGNRVNFLIDNKVVYTTSRVSMAQSAVKFTGYNVGTTTVENLSAKVFENQQAAETYLAEKNR